MNGMSPTLDVKASNVASNGDGSSLRITGLRNRTSMSPAHANTFCPISWTAQAWIGCGQKESDIKKTSKCGTPAISDEHLGMGLSSLCRTKFCVGPLQRPYPVLNLCPCVSVVSTCSSDSS